MKYSCVHCPYESDKKANYLRHLNRKFKCYKEVDEVTLNASVPKKFFTLFFLARFF